jgi:hypothetical protein
MPYWTKVLLAYQVKPYKILDMSPVCCSYFFAHGKGQCSGSGQGANKSKAAAARAIESDLRGRLVRPLPDALRRFSCLIKSSKSSEIVCLRCCASLRACSPNFRSIRRLRGTFLLGCIRGFIRVLSCSTRIFLHVYFTRSFLIVTKENP